METHNCNQSIRCSECGAYHGHAPECSKIDDLEYAKQQLSRYYRAWLEKETKHRERYIGYQKKIDRIKLECAIWKGKFMTVKHENNKLRKKIMK